MPLGAFHSFFCLLLLLVFVGLLHSADANIALEVSADTRRAIDLGVFGYGDSGEFQLKIQHFFIADPLAFLEPLPLGSTNWTVRHNESLGFVLDAVSSAQHARREKNYAKSDGAARRTCFIDDPELVPADPKSRFIFPLEGMTLKDIHEKEFATHVSVSGLYALFFYNCKGFGDSKTPLKPIAVSFSVVATQYNIVDSQRSYLSVGDRPLPMVYAFVAAVFGLITFGWILQNRNNAQYVTRIHSMMTLLVILKTLTLLFECIKYAHYAKSGEAAIWDVFYYIFLTAKGVMLFAVLLLLGSGWSFLKSFLSDQDKRVLLILIPCQVFINVAIAIIEETSEGSPNWATWLDLLRLLDIVCCCCVLLPIVWSIRYLRDAAGQDGKVALSLARNRIFRTFYIAVVVYIYFTRIVVIIVDGTVPPQHSWTAKLLRELGAVVFYTFTGWKFRPMSQNPYLHLDEEDIEELRQREEGVPKQSVEGKSADSSAQEPSNSSKAKKDAP